MQILTATFCGLIFVVSIISIILNPTDESVLKKYKKRMINAGVFMVLVLMIFPIKDTITNYFGTDVGIGNIEAVNATFADVKDKDCQGRETVVIDGKLYVVTDKDKYIYMMPSYLASETGMVVAKLQLEGKLDKSDLMR